MRIASSVQGMLFTPVLICLFFVLKAFCPESAGESCFADQFAVPIFLPLVAVYKIFGDSSIIGGHDFLLVIAYWAFVGFLIGLIIDLLWHRNKVVPVSEPGPKPVITPPHPTPKPLEAKPLVAPVVPPTPPAPKPVPTPVPVQIIPLIKVPPPPPPPKPAPLPPLPPKAPPAPITPIVQQQAPFAPRPIPITVKPPINLLDREEYK